MVQANPTMTNLGELYCSTEAPQKAMGMSPTEQSFGKQIRYFPLVTRQNYKSDRQWIKKVKEWKKETSRTKKEVSKRWFKNKRVLRQLQVHDMDSKKSLLGNGPLCWDQIGVRVRVRQLDQYGVRVDVNGRVTSRNRRNLRLTG